MSNPATRLITLIMLLQRRPNQKAADLARELGVSIRSLFRYLEMLEKIGIPIYSERGPCGGFSLVRGYKMPPLVLTPEEAVAVTLGAGLVEAMWGQLYREAAIAALAKLNNVLPDEQRAQIAWAQKSLVATGMNRANLAEISPHLEKLRQAIREQRQVHLLYYRAQSGPPSGRMVDPYALVHRGGWWYTVGFCHLRGALRSFRVDRMAAVELSAASFHTPEEFDIHAYLAKEFQAQPLQRMRLKFSPAAAAAAHQNRAFWDTIEEQPDGAVIVSMLTPDLSWAASTVLAYGPILTVIDPPELGSLVREWALAIANLYPMDKREGE
jgi:predicted DNA-binding transcriptional regulator YafY